MSREEICPRCGVAKLPDEECVVCAATSAGSDEHKPAASGSASPSSQTNQQLQRPPSQVPLQRPLQSQPKSTQAEAPQQTAGPQDSGQEKNTVVKEQEALRQRLKAAAWSARDDATGQPETEALDEKSPSDPDNTDKPRFTLPINKQTLLIGVAILLLAGLGGGWWWMSGKGSGTVPLSTNMSLPEHEYAIAAHHYCKEIVQTELDNPHSAKFPATDYHIQRQQDGSYVVTSWVDEQLNSGVQQRSNWRCQVRYIKNMAEASMDDLYNEKNWVAVRIGKNTARPTRP